MFSKLALFLIVTLSILVIATLPADALEEVPTTGSNASQEQSSTQDLTNAPVQSITFPTSTPLRSFSIPGASPTPSLPVPAHFAQPVTDGNFGNLASILAYKDQFNLDDAEALLQNHGDIRIITTCYIPVQLRTPQQLLRIVPEPKDKEGFKSRYESIGIGNYKATESNTISEQVLGIAVTSRRDCRSGPIS